MFLEDTSLERGYKMLNLLREIEENRPALSEEE
jgi:ribosome-binding factor A